MRCRPFRRSRGCGERRRHRELPFCEFDKAAQSRMILSNRIHRERIERVPVEIRDARWQFCFGKEHRPHGVIVKNRRLQLWHQTLENLLRGLPEAHCGKEKRSAGRVPHGHHSAVLKGIRQERLSVPLQRRLSIDSSRAGVWPKRFRGQ